MTATREPRPEESKGRDSGELPFTICTLCEGSYWYGTAALVNSMLTHGFRGRIEIGYKGEIPRWLQANIENAGSSEDGIPVSNSIRFTEVKTRRHLTNLKAQFLLELVEATDSDKVGLFAYFDPDITNRCDVDFYRKWISKGIALCEDMNSPMSSRHPIRLEWLEYFAIVGDTNFSEQYFNGGFVGVQSTDRDFIQRWKDLHDLAERDGVDLSRFGIAGRTHLFQKTDQDFLNIAAMEFGRRVSPIGKEGMDFVPGGYLMSHATGERKPWNSFYILSALRGIRPRNADRHYWKNAKGPIRVHSSARILLAKLDFFVASAIARVIGRG